MEEKRWESCNAEALLEEFFSQDDLRQLALSTGELLGCPLLVLDDTFHIAAHHLPLGFSDALFETAVRRGEISYEAGAIISRNPMLTAGWADYVQLADSPYRRRFAPLVSAGVRLGCQAASIRIFCLGILVPQRLANFRQKILAIFLRYY